MHPTNERRHVAARLAAASRHHPDDAETITLLRTMVAEQSIAAHIEKVVATAPPLTAGQRQRLAALLAQAPEVSV